MNNKIAYLILCLVLALTTIILSACAEEPKELTVYCAAGLTGAFNEMGQMYKNESNVSVVFDFDGTQVLRTQIENGAYADVLLSASNKYTDALKAEGFMNNSSVSVFARSWQAVIIPVNNPAKIQNLSDLAKPGLKIVMGTKDLPITESTMQILDKLAADPAYGPQYKEKVLSNVISRETDVNFIISKIALGEADAGFAHKSEVPSRMADKVTLIEIPERYNVKSEYSIGVLKQTKYPTLAEKFIDLVKSKEGKAILVKYGYEVV